MWWLGLGTCKGGVDIASSVGDALGVAGENRVANLSISASCSAYERCMLRFAGVGVDGLDDSGVAMRDGYPLIVEAISVERFAV